MTTQQYSIEGMHCPHCVQTVQATIDTVEGVRSVDISLEQGTLSLEIDDEIFDEALLIESLGEEGFKVVRK